MKSQEILENNESNNWFPYDVIISHIWDNIKLS